MEGNDIYCYILDKAKNDWIESDNLFLHDIALLIENTEKKVYFYKGPKSDKRDHAMGKELAQSVVQKFGYSFIELGDVIPLKIQKEIDLLLGDNIDPRTYKEERTIFMLIFVILGVIGALFIFALFINNLRMFGWRKSLLVYGATSSDFEALFRISRILLYISIGFLIAHFVSALLTKRIFLIIASMVMIAVAVGAYFYILEGNGLFARAPEEILRSELLLHYLWLLMVLIAEGGIIFWTSMLIFRHTEFKPKKEMSLEEKRKAAHPTILRDKPPVELKEIEKE